MNLEVFSNLNITGSYFSVITHHWRVFSWQRRLMATSSYKCLLAKQTHHHLLVLLWVKKA
ncbi:hypothetical protein [Moraxella lacunata]|uniref:hypothetical protein n=1 Tax=Moraxella lacunata TaxID=477 RepID=UPI003EE2B703